MSQVEAIAKYEDLADNGTMHPDDRRDLRLILALAREQQARIGELTMLLEEADEKCCCGVCGT